jgi:hypothetical protein
MQLFPLKINNNERGPFGQGIRTGGHRDDHAGTFRTFAEYRNQRLLLKLA